MSIKRLAIEVVFLVVALFLALAVDEAWEDHENGVAANLALTRIHQELDGNRQLIKEENEQHKLELQRIQPVIVQLDSQSSIPEDFDPNLNLQISILRDTAWRSAQLTDVLKYLPYEQIQSLASVYSLQELYQSQMSQVFNYQGNVEFIQAEPEVQLRSAFQSLLKTYVIEQALLDAYGQVGTETEGVAQ